MHLRLHILHSLHTLKNERHVNPKHTMKRRKNHTLPRIYYFLCHYFGGTLLARLCQFLTVELAILKYSKHTNTLMAYLNVTIAFCSSRLILLTSRSRVRCSRTIVRFHSFAVSVGSFTTMHSVFKKIKFQYYSYHFGRRRRLPKEIHGI